MALGIDLRQLQRAAHEHSLERGFWEEGRSYGDSLALVHLEVSEAHEAYRSDGLATWQTERDESGLERRVPSNLLGKPEGLVFELADVLVRLADVCEYYAVDLSVGAVNAAANVEITSVFSLISTVGEWACAVHWQLDQAFISHLTQEREDVATELGGVVYGVEWLTQRYSLEPRLDAAVVRKMDYNRTGRRYSGRRKHI